MPGGKPDDDDDVPISDLARKKARRRNPLSSSDEDDTDDDKPISHLKKPASNAASKKKRESVPREEDVIDLVSDGEDKPFLQGGNGQTKDVQRRTKQELGTCLDDCIMKIRRARNPAEEHKEVHNFLYHLAHAFRSDHGLGIDNIEGILSRLARENLTAEIRGIMHGFWAVANNNESLLTAQGGENLHFSIDVAGDGSCFYQCMYYWLLWLLPLNEIHNLTSVHAMKMHVWDELFPVGRNGTRTLNPAYQAEKDKIVERFQLVEEDESQCFNARNMGYLMGLLDSTGRKLDERRGRKVWAETLVAQMFSLAFNVQIIIFNKEYAKDQLNDGKVQYVQKYDNFGHEEMRAYFNGCGKFNSYDYEGRFTGRPVALLFFDVDHVHYQIISRFKLMANMNQNGMGTRGQRYTDIITLHPFHYRDYENFRMPTLHKCMRCRKYIL